MCVLEEAGLKPKLYKAKLGVGRGLGKVVRRHYSAGGRLQATVQITPLCALMYPARRTFRPFSVA